MDKPHSKWRHVYALVRFDYPVDSENPENSVAIVEVLTSKAAAEQEAGRLKRINDGCDYAVYTTRLISIQ